MWGGRQLVRASRTYGRIVQHGTQSRSAPAMTQVIGHVRSGTFGDVCLARRLCFKRRHTIGRAPIEEVLAHVDYDLWTGPAPLEPFTKNRRTRTVATACRS